MRCLPSQKRTSKTKSSLRFQIRFQISSPFKVSQKKSSTYKIQSKQISMRSSCMKSMSPLYRQQQHHHGLLLIFPKITMTLLPGLSGDGSTLIFLQKFRMDNFNNKKNQNNPRAFKLILHIHKKKYIILLLWCSSCKPQ